MRRKDQWRDTDILSVQPFRELTNPFISFIQRIYFVVGLAQLIYMVLFSVAYTPSVCSLSYQFNLSQNGCETIDNDSMHFRPYQAAGYIIWPGILNAFIIVDLIGLLLREVAASAPSSMTVFVAILKRIFCHGDGAGGVYRRRNNVEGFQIYTFLALVIGKLPSIAFCVSTFYWYSMIVNEATYQEYLEALSMVFLFGYTAMFVFFSGITKEFYIFSLMLIQTIVKDILSSFLLIFVSVVVGFAFAIHSLRMTTLPEGDANYINGTVYEVFLAALTIGNLADETMDPYYNASGGRLGFYRMVFAAYVTFAAIILLNVLIAMMSSRYENAKRNAENVWRFETVATGVQIHDFKIFRAFVKMTRWCFYCLCCCLCCGCEPIYVGNEDNGGEIGRMYVDVIFTDLT